MTQTQTSDYLIMIIDDLPSNLAYFNDALITFGYRTATAGDGKEGVEKIRQLSPDLILSDVNMPVMDGFELSMVVKGDPATKDIPLVLVTANDDRQALVKGLNSGVDDFLIKPVNLSELQARVRNLLLVKDYSDHMKRYAGILEEQVALRTTELEQALEEVSRSNLRLREATQDTIQRLATAAEFRDKDTAAHIWRMSHFTHAVAEELGMDSAFLESILYASPMHDVGKIGTPDNILLKPGKFEPAEKETMEQHTIIGERILGKSDHPLLALAREIAGGHHEKWDGSGYPRRKAGEEIPISARIAAVADVYDALTTKRIYKAAWEPQDAFKFIAEESGSHFDPAVSAAMMNIRPKILELQQSKLSKPD